jgi:hypothetical protein
LYYQAKTCFGFIKVRIRSQIITLAWNKAAANTGRCQWLSMSIAGIKT